MNSTRKTLTAALTLAIVSVLGIGTAAGADHLCTAAPPAASVNAAAQAGLPVQAGPGSLVTRPDGPVVPEGFPHEVHREERLLEDEREHTEAAPHTLARFAAGSN
jgi:hypothetical protein